MARLCQLKCDKCAGEWSYIAAGPCLYYVRDASVLENPDPLSNPEIIWVYERLVWCNKCRAVTQAEQLPDIPMLRRRLEEHEAFLLSGEETSTDVRLKIAGVKTQIEWIKSRQSPPKCVTCGSTDIVPFEEGDRHPGCGGAIQGLNVEPNHVFVQHDGHTFFDWEGNRID